MIIYDDFRMSIFEKQRNRETEKIKTENRRNYEELKELVRKCFLIS
jgi:hypothetical protein